MVGIELVRDKQKIPANTEGNRTRDLCRENGLLPGLGGVYGNVLRIQPPLIITEDELLEVVKIVDSALTQVENYPMKSAT